MTFPTRLIAALACALLVAPLSGQAHGIAGDRVFPATLTIDDPAVGDELSLPTFALPPGQTGTAANEYDYGFEWDKTIIKGFGFAVNSGFTNLRQPASADGNKYGWNDPVVTLKYTFLVNGRHEAMASFGVQKEIGGVGAVNSLGEDASGWTQPTLYFGKGFGDLPASAGLLRPFAITGEVGYQWADEPHPTAADGTVSINPDIWNIGLSLQYNMQYLRAQVKDYGLPEFVNNVIPLVEFAYSTPASASHTGTTSGGTLAPGFLYEGGSYQIGIEALVPTTHSAGNELGMIAQLHFFLDDVFPNSLGKPLFDGEAPRL